MLKREEPPLMWDGKNPTILFSIFITRFYLKKIQRRRMGGGGGLSLLDSHDLQLKRLKGHSLTR